MDVSNSSASHRGRPLENGLMLPIAEGMMAGATARWSDLLALARAAENLGFDSLWVPDHLLLPWRDESGRTEGCWECWSLLAALARSAGLLVEIPGSAPYPPGYPGLSSRPPLPGSAEELAEHFRAFAREGYSSLQLWVNPPTVAGIEAIAAVLALLDRG